MEKQDFIQEYEITEHTPEKIRKQFIKSCEFLIKNADKIVVKDLTGVRSISLNIDFKPNEIITLVKHEEISVDMKGNDYNER